MARDPIHLVQAFLGQHNPPLQVWLAPDAAQLLGSSLAALPDASELLPVPGAVVPSGPAILLATAADIAGPHREALLELREAALPGRPVICGGTADKELLLDAINRWRVFHLLPAHPSRGELVDAVVRAHRASALEHAATLCAQQLRLHCDDLQAVMAELEATRELLLQAERMSAVAGFSRALSARLRQHLDRLRTLERALGDRPDDARRADLLDFTMQSIHAIEALLADLLTEADTATTAVGPQNTPGGERTRGAP
jgi:hypothetical protein